MRGFLFYTPRIRILNFRGFIMDDQSFDQKTASDWIKTIESEGAKVRETDIYPKLKSWINEISPEKVLDLGCGQGICCEKVGTDSMRYYGIDPSPFLIERAMEVYSSPNKSFLVGNAYEIPLSNSSIDAVFSIAVWHLLRDQQTASRELSRVLKQGGHFLIITAHPDYYADWTSSYTESSLNGSRFEGKNKLADGSESIDVLYLHNMKELRDSLEVAGLAIQKTESFRKFLLIKGKKVR